MSKNPQRILSARVPDDTAWAVKAAAIELRLSIQEWVNQAVDDKLARQREREADSEATG